MTSRIGIQPEWAEDLLSMWALSDATGGARGHDRACPMFKLWGVVDGDRDESDDSYSSVELDAMRQALEAMREQSPEDYMAIVATFKPWAGIQASEETAARARRAGLALAMAVDKIMEG